MDDLKGKVVLVTGASTGIGAACAKAFGALGCKVAVHYNSSKAAAMAVAEAVEKAGGEALVVQGDLRVSAECKRIVTETVKRFKRIDVLINNAGALVKRVPITDVSDEIFDDIVGLNVRSMMMCTKYSVSHMTRGGSIINLTSIAARNGGGPGASLYAGSKGFVSTATKSIAKELAGRQIRVNAVAPGVITTPFHDKFSTPEQLEAMRLTIPMARLGTADECVGAFIYLASEKLSSYVTGQIIEVNGGQYMP
ncbi:MAG TPA: oxidoreductase [Polaromonas sp.]|uniref:SDR family NAD(P)-dependent oxidoreductase n=1 Tax=Polaromonas sp. UBA4122 TaxID=1947074 RepID=UPI000ECC11A9|nr:SDR family oxidoreductase [Polaromonas sp. UBA4122]HAL38981.1 oxidoreductase [Polaromonas sp.]